MNSRATRDPKEDALRELAAEGLCAAFSRVMVRHHVQLCYLCQQPPHTRKLQRSFYLFDNQETSGLRSIS